VAGGGCWGQNDEKGVQVHRTNKKRGILDGKKGEGGSLDEGKGGHYPRKLRGGRKVLQKVNNWAIGQLIIGKKKGEGGFRKLRLNRWLETKHK